MMTTFHVMQIVLARRANIVNYSLQFHFKVKRKCLYEFHLLVSMFSCVKGYSHMLFISFGLWFMA